MQPRDTYNELKRVLGRQKENKQTLGHTDLELSVAEQDDVISYVILSVPKNSIQEW